MIDFKQKVILIYDNKTDVVTFEFDSCEMDTQEMFMKWVCFMNAIGYILDPVEMEKMWNGESDDHSLKVEHYLEVIRRFEKILHINGIDMANNPMWYKSRQDLAEQLGLKRGCNY